MGGPAWFGPASCAEHRPPCEAARGGRSWRKRRPIGAEIPEEKTTMATTPSLRQLWKMYKELLASDIDMDGRELVLARNSFYVGARGILKIQSHLLKRGRYDELHAMIERHGRQIDNLIKPARRERH
jgi:hypothetical protein